MKSGRGRGRWGAGARPTNTRGIILSLGGGVFFYSSLWLFVVGETCFIFRCLFSYSENFALSSVFLQKTVRFCLLGVPTVSCVRVLVRVVRLCARPRNARSCHTAVQHALCFVFRFSHLFAFYDFEIRTNGNFSFPLSIIQSYRKQKVHKKKWV